MKKIIFAILVSVLLFACKNTTKKTIELNDILLSADGPYFEGPNSFQANLLSTLKNNNINPDNVDVIMLKSAVITMPDSIEDGLIQNLALQLVSNTSPMQKVAFMNPLPLGSREINLTIAQEQEDIDDIFSNEEVITLLDVNFSKDFDQNISFKAKLKFEITINN